MDSQVVEVFGRNYLVGQLMLAGLEVALPMRDHGIDLIAFDDVGGGMLPVQVKAAHSASFSVDRKYARFPGLALAYVWRVAEPARTEAFALTYAEALAVAEAMGYLRTESWKRGTYSTTRPSARLLALLEPFRATPDRWRLLVRSRIDEGGS